LVDLGVSVGWGVFVTFLGVCVGARCCGRVLVVHSTNVVEVRASEVDASALYSRWNRR